MASVSRSPCGHIKLMLKTFTEWLLYPGQQIWRKNPQRMRCDSFQVSYSRANVLELYLVSLRITWRACKKAGIQHSTLELLTRRAEVEL